jgi:hypothetical protein
MVRRCVDLFREDAMYYTAKGITVCERWSPVLSSGKKNPQAFINFLADMGERPEGTTIGRLNENEGYSPTNCAWQTLPEQNVSLSYEGNEAVTVDGVTRTKAEWAEHLGIQYDSLMRRLQRGWGLDAYRQGRRQFRKRDAQ